MLRTPHWLSSIFLILSAVASVADAKPKNVLLICVDDLRPELKSFGADYIKSPNIDRLAEQGRAFHRHYVNSPSCGPSRFTLLTGRYGTAKNDALFQRAKKMGASPEGVHPSMPEWFRSHGYTTVSVGKVSHHPGGLGGPDWDDPNVVEMPGAWDRNLMPTGTWQHPRGSMHGLAHGEIRVKAEDMALFQAEEGDDSIYPDGLITEEALRQLQELSEDDAPPFFMAVGIIRPHLPFGAPAKYLKMYDGVEIPPVPHPEKPKGLSTWHKSGEFMKYKRWERDPRTDEAFAIEVKRHYAACVTYADTQVGRILDQLEKSGRKDDTIVLLWGDHGWNLGEHAIWGKHNLFEEALRSPLVISYPGITRAGEKTDAIVETLDIFPTLCDLLEIPTPHFVQGESLRDQLEDPNADGHTALGYRGGARTLRTDNFRLTLHKSGGAELYDHRTEEAETRNVAADHPDLVEALSVALSEKLK
ncbi:sulfatase [Pelagicoccus mobilis]|uniref:Sulfatase n=1 Tax=Pelagicoccus mobilis TaxID=415221 RepID=A0A934VPA0_9BACT|nr:sulfatase [Pelagicoccus mobilis]MBK1875318.1 sulfatase [Pelagicoccus mobilis]